MGKPMNNERGLRRLGREMAQELDKAPVDPAIARTRARLFQGVEARSPRATSRWKVLGGLAFAGFAALTALMVRPRPMGFSVGDPPVTGSIGDWIIAPPASSLTLRFNERSRFLLGVSTKAKVASARAGGATLLLANGDLLGDVSAARDEGSFRVTAGPFEVAARDARFSVTWDQALEILTVRSLAGSVVVKGPKAPPEVTVTAGNALRASAKEGRMELDGGSLP
jgi:ferric-dicitrate binding protein FerR (iron transport regulator)